MKQAATEDDIEKVKAKAIEQGHEPKVLYGVERTVVAVHGKVIEDNRGVMRLLDNVHEVIPIGRSYKLASKTYKDTNTEIKIKDLTIGGKELAFIAGPDSAEYREQTLETAEAVIQAGGNGLRGGAFKPRTSPYSFQGLGEEGLVLLKEAADKHKLPLFSEIMDIQHLQMMENYVDVLQIGARNMQNFKLLEAVGESKLPVLLKRGMSATLEELLLASEYILSRGNENVILCERGIRTFETATRNTFDINAIPYLKKKQNYDLILIKQSVHFFSIKQLNSLLNLAKKKLSPKGQLLIFSLKIKNNKIPCFKLMRKKLNASLEKDKIFFKIINHSHCWNC